MPSQVRLTRQECFESGKHLYVTRRVMRTSQLHSHEFFEIEIILSGSGIHIMNTKEYQLCKGMVWLSTPADFHEILVDETAEYWTIGFDETVVSPERVQALYAAKTLCHVVSNDVLNRLNMVSKLIYEEHLRNGYVQPLMEYLLDSILPSSHQRVQPTPIHRAILYVETFFRSNPSLSDVAGLVGLSPTYFGNLFKKEIGETYISFLNRRKVTCAMMLLESGVSVSTACFESGFGSLSGFLHTFKKVTGMSPNDYRKKMAKSK